LGPFRLDIEGDLLFRGSAPLALGRRAIALLRTMVERPGEVISKDTLIEAAWPGQAVEESNLTVQIAALRRALGEEPGGNRWIETLPRRGYRFVGPVGQPDNGVLVEPPQPDIAHPAAAPSDDAERRQITVISCELLGATGRTDGLDLEDLRVAVAAFRRCISDIVGRYNGSISSQLGNTVLIVFGYPGAREHDTERAVRAGLELCEAVRALRPETSEPIRCRVGIETGIAIIGDFVGNGELGDHEIVGDAPNFVALLRASAQPDTVVVGPVARRLLGNLFDCRDLGTIDAAIGGEPMRRWQVLGESPVASRFEALRAVALTPLVGRGEECELLLRRWEQAKHSDGQVVLLAGEPGIGKSRISTVLMESLRAEPHTLLRYFCSPYRTESALYPIISQLEHAARFAPDDSTAEKLEKLAALLEQTAAPDEEIALLAELLSLLNAAPDATVSALPPRQKKEQTFVALVRLLEALTKEAPVLAVFEDAHWADPSSLELLDRVVERVRHLPVLLVITFRPEYHAPWVGMPEVTLLTLTRLGHREAVVLTEQVTGSERLPDTVVRQIVDRADGVPLFIEELTKSVMESGLRRKNAARGLLDGAPALFAIPMTLHASLLARIDHLGPAAKEVAQVGASIGHDFSYELLTATVQSSETALKDGLGQLVGAGLVFQRGTPPDATFQFRHALVQDAAYSTLLRNPRRTLHARIARALGELFPSLQDTQAEILAHHFTEAGLVEQAVAFWSRAGQQSAAKSAFVEAIAQLQRGLALIIELPDSAQRKQRELELQVTLAPAMMEAIGHTNAEVAQVLERARSLIVDTAAAGTILHFSVLYGLWVAQLLGGDAKATLVQGQEFLALAQSQTHSGLLLVGHRLVGTAMILSGDFPEALSHLDRAVELYVPEEHRALAFRFGADIGITALAVRAWALWHRGYPDQASQAAEEAVRQARQSVHRHTLAYALFYSCLTAITARDTAQVERSSNSLVDWTREHGFAMFLGYGQMVQGWVMAQREQGMAAIDRFHEGLKACEAAGVRRSEPFILRGLAEALALTGRIDEGLTVLVEAFAGAEASGARWSDVELHLVRGDLLRRLPSPNWTEVETSYRSALATARKQGSRGLELRAAVSLARLWRDQGKTAEAHELVAPVYGWFTEGFDTPDLKEAKALLDELGTASPA
jgi:DNA-binding winged helix-turn-helix (wHTH) protein/predicted ATPase